MPDQAQRNRRPHLVLSDTSQTKAFTSHSAKRSDPKPLPELNRAQHGAALRAQLQAIQVTSQDLIARQQDIGLNSGLGLQIQFRSQPDVELAFEKLHNEPSHIELLSIHTEGEYTYANVFVPDGKLDHFERKIAAYLEEKKDKNDKARDNRPLLDTIESIRAAELRELWTDAPELLPNDPEEVFWWEVWLPVREQRDLVIGDFRKLAALAGCKVSQHHVSFPERTVMLMRGSQRQFSQSVLTLNCVAELRRAKETAELFDGLDAEEQQQWKDELLARTTFPPHQDDVPRVWLGNQQRHKGSLHQDVWTGTAADLASRSYLAVYPAMGWWRTRPKLERYELPARYSLIVSIRTPETEVDIYNAVAAQIPVPVAIVT